MKLGKDMSARCVVPNSSSRVVEMGKCTVAAKRWKLRNKRRNKIMVQLGKRYHCEDCGTQMLCTKPGEGQPVCCDKEMQLQQPKPQPSSD